MIAEFVLVNESIFDVVKFSECVIYSDYSVNVLNDNPIPHLKRSVFLSSPPHQDGDQEAEVVSF